MNEMQKKIVAGAALGLVIFIALAAVVSAVIDSWRGDDQREFTEPGLPQRTIPDP